MRIYTNIMAINAYRNVNLRYSALMKSMERLFQAAHPALLMIQRTGHRERMWADSRLKQASCNAQDAISMLQVAEGAMNETSALAADRELTAGSNRHKFRIRFGINSI